MKERKKRFSVVLPESLVNRIEEQALVMRRSRNAQIQVILERYFRNQDDALTMALKELEDRPPQD